MLNWCAVRRHREYNSDRVDNNENNRIVNYTVQIEVFYTFSDKECTREIPQILLMLSM